MGKAWSESEQLAAYLEHRPRLVRLAYRHLGAVGEAEDVAQDAWLRFQSADRPQDAGRYLSRIVTNLCLDRMKSARARRETYVGPWLPEPLVERAGTVDPEAGDAALDISFGVMRALESLTPLERAVLFLHDLFEMPFEEVAETLHRSPAACRKMATRARAALAGHRSRFQPSQNDIDRFVTGFSQTMQSGDIGPLKQLLAEDIEFVSDGGGKAASALNVIVGADKVARMLFGLGTRQMAVQPLDISTLRINGSPALAITIGGRIDQTVSLELDAHGLIAAIYVVRNPDKLVRVKASEAPD